jgi:alginate O-acetyltransferase complex protein AlgI
MTSQSLISLSVVVLLWAIAWQLRSLKMRQAVLLATSYLFYANWGIGFLAVLIASSLMNYALGIVLRRQPTAGRLWMSVACNVVLLSFFKYLPPLFEGAPANAWLPDFLHRIVMPVGMSFWTFQGLSYLFDTYREEELDPSLLEFCLYMAFWPTVLAGPVCRLPNMLPQFRRLSGFNLADISVGAWRLLQGVIMKMVLAQILASGLGPGSGVTAGFDQIKDGWGGLDVLLLGIGFGFQLFFDFAGYSHMVIGVARLFGMQLEENFHRPFYALTPSVFWTRWHMSLSFWIRDYIFVPLAAARRDVWWPYVVFVLAMTLFGLWHAAKATFILWGVYHGLLLVTHRLGQRIKRRQSITWPASVGTLLAWASTFCFVSLGWIFFRAHDLDQALAMFQTAFVPSRYRHFALPTTFYILVPVMTIGYFICNYMVSFLRAWSARYREDFRNSAELYIPLRPMGSLAGVNMIAAALFDFFSERMWWWLTPMVLVLSFFISLAIFAQGSAIPVTPVMYTMF